MAEPSVAWDSCSLTFNNLRVRSEYITEVGIDDPRSLIKIGISGGYYVDLDPDEKADVKVTPAGMVLGYLGFHALDIVIANEKVEKGILIHADHILQGYYWIPYKLLELKARGYYDKIVSSCAEPKNIRPDTTSYFYELCNALSESKGLHSYRIE